ncbi:MAG: hypothetical protein Q8O55_07570 [Dehalococcoidales bacterium]|nr:hypothetical protein [Dehalococcoidales bacterium]
MSSLVEYLSEQTKSDGEPLTQLVASGVSVPVFPPQTTSTFILSPAEGEFALLLFNILYDNANVPESFSIYAQHRGIRPLDGITSQGWASIGVQGWLVITEAQKLLIRVTSRSNMNQRLNYGFQLLVVKTREDFNLVNALLAKYSSSNKDEIMKTNALIAQMISNIKPGMPRPSL